MDRRFDFSDASDVQEIALDPYLHHFRKAQKYATFLAPVEENAKPAYETHSALPKPPQQNSNYKEEIQKLSEQYKQQLLRARKSLANFAMNTRSAQEQRELDVQVWCCDEICKNIDRILEYTRQQKPRVAKPKQSSRLQDRTQNQTRGMFQGEAAAPVRPAELLFGVRAEIAFLKRRPLGLLIPNDGIYSSGCEVSKSVQQADLKIYGAHLPHALYAPRLRSVIQQSQCTAFEVFAAYAVVQYFCRSHGSQLLDFKGSSLVNMSYLVDGNARYYALLYVFFDVKGAVRREPVCAFPIPYDGMRFATPITTRNQQEPDGFAMIEFECSASCRLAVKLLQEIRKMVVMHA